MTKPTHTPTPWKFEHGEDEGTLIYVEAPYFHGICSTANHDQGMIDAEHIVTCVNSHEKLVADNKVMREALGDIKVQQELLAEATISKTKSLTWALADEALEEHKQREK